VFQVQVSHLDAFKARYSLPRAVLPREPLVCYEGNIRQKGHCFMHTRQNTVRSRHMSGCPDSIRKATTHSAFKIHFRGQRPPKRAWLVPLGRRFGSCGRCFEVLYTATQGGVRRADSRHMV